MIDINFVPEQMRKRRRSELLSGGVFNIPREVMVSVGGGIIALLLCVDMLVFVVKIAKFIEYHHVKSKWQSVLPERTTTDKIGRAHV